MADWNLAAKPNEFSGKQIDWANWKLELMSCLQVIGVLLPPDEVQEAVGRPKLAEFGPTTHKDKIAKGKQLYAMAVGVLGGRALAIARNAKDRNGWELWRQLAVDYEPVRASRALSQLTEVLNPRLPGSEAGYKDRLMTPERQIADY